MRYEDFSALRHRVTAEHAARRGVTLEEAQRAYARYPLDFVNAMAAVLLPEMPTLAAKDAGWYHTTDSRHFGVYANGKTPAWARDGDRRWMSFASTSGFDFSTPEATRTAILREAHLIPFVYGQADPLLVHLEFLRVREYAEAIGTCFVGAIRDGERQSMPII